MTTPYPLNRCIEAVMEAAPDVPRAIVLRALLDVVVGHLEAERGPVAAAEACYRAGDLIVGRAQNYTGPRQDD